MRILLPVVVLLLLASGPAPGWGPEAHRRILRAALDSLSPASRRPYEGLWNDLRRTVVMPDALNAVPEEASRHWVDIEKTDPAYLARLRDALKEVFGDAGWAGEDARGVGAGVDADLFPSDPPPWARSGPLWDSLPLTITAFRERYPREEQFIGTVIYQPYLYAVALSRALAAADRRRTAQMAGYLAHYASDLAVPLHVTSNYKGQYTGNLVYSDKERGDVHSRFETGYTNARAAPIAAALKAGLKGWRPSPLGAGDITPRAVALAREGYSALPSLIEADRKACAAADPRTAWDAWVIAVDPVFGPIAAGRMEAAVRLVAVLLESAGRPGFRPVHSGKMGAQ
jgi:hypothetical protein